MAAARKRRHGSNLSGERMGKTIKVRSELRGDVAIIRMLLRHPMKVGRVLKSGERIKPHFISELECRHNGTIVMTGHFGAGVSANPYVEFRITGAARGDNVAIRWVDNQGGQDAVETTL